MLTATRTRFGRETVPGAVPDANWSRRVGELCLDLCRTVGHVDSDRELIAIAAELVVRDLQAAAAGFWILDQNTGTWRLVAAAGELDDIESRSAVSVIPAAPGRPEIVIDTGFEDEVTRRWRHAACADRGMESPTSSSAIIRTTGNTLGIMIVWSRGIDQSELKAAAESVARDLSTGLESIRRSAGMQDLARLASVVFDFAPLAIVGINVQRRCVRWNPAATELFGWPESEALKNPVCIAPAEHRHAFWATFDRCLRDAVPVQARLPGQRWDGSPLNLRARFVPLMQRANVVSEVVLMISDETGQESVQQYLQIELDVSALLSNSTALGIVGRRVLSVVCHGLDWQAAELWQAADDGNGWRLSAAWDAGDSQGVTEENGAGIVRLPFETGLPGMARKERRIVWSSDMPDRRGPEPHGAPRPLDRYDSVAVPIRADDEIQAVLVFYGDEIPEQDEGLNKTLYSIAEQVGQAVARERMSETLQKTEDVLRQTRKMEAIGMLAGGIAHDFNNLLMVILGNCELLLDHLVEPTQYPELVGEIRAAGERAASLTRQLLTFSRKRAAEPEVLNLNQLLADLDRMLQRVVGETIVIETNLAADTNPVRMDRVEFEQVMLNLAANARDAMPTGGKLTIAAANVSLGLKAVTPYPDVQPGEFVALSIADTGCGMDEQTRSRAFEPFFTTKGVEKGTGLGLATVYGIIRRSRGIVQLDSTPGVGTRFTIYLPRAAIGIKPRRIEERPAEDPRGSEMVLVVEDEDVLRKLVQQILEVHGYTVHAVSNGPAALRFLEQSTGTVELLLTDIVMPQMSGIQLVAEARKRQAELPAIFMSGYPDLADPSGNGIPRGPQLLCKPFTSDALARAVRKALDSASVRATSAGGQARLHS